jgi:hypothetical protein
MSQAHEGPLAFAHIGDLHLTRAANFANLLFGRKCKPRRERPRCSDIYWIQLQRLG